ncbi:MAG: NEAT domain-containing protein [Eggerthellaceae bacterium]|nr:NEAT domain-containing protein [Eggerthellaceae bacterium]
MKVQAKGALVVLAALMALAVCALAPAAQASAYEYKDVPIHIYKTGTTEDSMAAGYFDSAADVTTASDGSATVVLSLTDAAVEYGLEVGAGTDPDVTWGTVVSAEGESPQRVQISVASTEGAQAISFKTNVAMMGGRVMSADLVLDMPPVDKAKLQEAINAAKALDSNAYYPTTFALVESQLATCEELNTSTTATQDEVDAAAERLQALMAEETGGYLAKKSTVVNPQDNGIYVPTFTSYNASGYGTGARTLDTVNRAGQFPTVDIVKDADGMKLRLYYASNIDMQAVYLNDDEAASTKEATGEKRTVTNSRTGVTAEYDEYIFSMPIEDIALDNKLTFRYDTGTSFGVHSSSVYLIAQGMELLSDELEVVNGDQATWVAGQPAEIAATAQSLAEGEEVTKWQWEYAKDAQTWKVSGAQYVAEGATSTLTIPQCTNARRAPMAWRVTATTRMANGSIRTATSEGQSLLELNKLAVEPASEFKWDEGQPVDIVAKVTGFDEGETIAKAVWYYSTDGKTWKKSGAASDFDAATATVHIPSCTQARKAPMAWSVRVTTSAGRTITGDGISLAE